MPTRHVFTKEQLLAIAARTTTRPLTSAESEKFAIIEVGEPTPAPSRKEAEPASNTFSRDAERGGGGGRHERRGGGGRNRDDEPRGGGTSGGGNGGGGRQHMYDRFAPPSRNYRNSGNRDTETFDEGYKYELEQKNAHLRQLNETIQREEKKGLAQASNAAQAAKDTTPVTTSAAASSAQSVAAGNELDKLLAVIGTGEASQENTSRRSRFFNSTDGATPPPPAASAAAPVANAWGRPAGTVSPFTTSVAAMNASNAASTPFTVSPANIPGGAVFGAGQQEALMAGMGQQLGTHNALAAAHMLPTRGGGIAPTTAGGITRAEDLERALKLGHTTGSTAATVTAAQPSQSLKPTSQGPIQASDLESFLKQQAQSSAVSAGGMPRAQTPPQQQPQGQKTSATLPAGMFTVNSDATNIRGLPASNSLQQMQMLQFQQQQLQRLQQMQHLQQQQQQQRAQVPTMTVQQGQAGMPMNLGSQNAVYAQQLAYAQANAGFQPQMAAYLRQQQQQQQQQQAQQQRIGTFPTNPQQAYQQMMQQQQQAQQRGNNF